MYSCYPFVVETQTSSLGKDPNNNVEMHPRFLNDNWLHLLRAEVSYTHPILLRVLQTGRRGWCMMTNSNYVMLFISK